ncbi:MAG: ribose-5-phosphate isomerase, partial [Jeotgalicoccus halophilus]|nr:ribose-5-phosphate isomerase [Jeotgalicoccus aerolatus]
MKVVIASDHGGINLKKAVTEYLTEKKIDFTDL